MGWEGAVDWLTSHPGVHSALAGGPTTVVTARDLTSDGATVEVRRGSARHRITDRSAPAGLVQRLDLFRAGPRALHTAILLPSDDPTDGALPVLLDPYGGPHAQRVQRSRALFDTSQWFADQGFAVVVADGRGTPGRGPGFEREVRGDLAGPVLEDQIDALAAAAEREPRLDLSRVAIRGWSFGGYLAALAVLRRPDVFHAAIAGAPVTDWRLYDTHYTERYLGRPGEEPENYARTDLTAEAASLSRPLMVIHGLADDNVVAAHTLRLSRSLLEAGRPHCVLPLSDVTHMTPQEEVAENLLLLQLEFLRRSLADPGSSAPKVPKTPA
ncbi:MAG: alpha/beta hydrolase family protein [Acidimicrobiales bacterium]